MALQAAELKRAADKEQQEAYEAELLAIAEENQALAADKERDTDVEEVMLQNQKEATELISRERDDVRFPS